MSGDVQSDAITPPSTPPRDPEKAYIPPISPSSDGDKDYIVDIPDQHKVAGDYTDEDGVPIDPPGPFTTISSKKSTEPWEPPNVRTLESCPEGYPMLAAFLSSDQNFMVYRGFGYLHSRCLLYLQDEIMCMERRLDQLDQEDASSSEEKIRKTLRSRALDEWNKDSERPELLRKIKEKLIEYDGLLAKAKDLTSFQKPSKRDYRGVRRWLHNWNPLIQEEQDYVLQREDLVTLRHGRECAGFDGFIESVLHKVDCKLIRWIFTTPETRAKSHDKCVRYFAQARVDNLVNAFITFVIAVLLILPVAALFRLSSLKRHDSPVGCISVLMVFTLLFSLIMSILTRARRSEVFAASAA